MKTAAIRKGSCDSANGFMPGKTPEPAARYACGFPERRKARQMQTVQIIDSHTGGEPTRLVIGGGPALGSGPLLQRLDRLRTEFDDFRRAVVCEPRGSKVLVGALLCEPHEPGCELGVIFFNYSGYIGMCGHGTIGLVASLAYQGRLQPGVYGIDTPVGAVKAELHDDGSITVYNVASWRYLKDVGVDVPGLGRITGDVAWGGNWFFLVSDNAGTIELSRVGALSDHAARIVAALEVAGITGADGAPVDHVELFADSPTAGCNSRNFVLCPGGAYDRSPCGTGTSAKLACLAADGKLKESEVWRQESIVGSVFDASYRQAGTKVLPAIRGRAYVTAATTLLVDPEDPFRWGIPG
jgi:4-hydroxyproline epimerase